MTIIYHCGYIYIYPLYLLYLYNMDSGYLIMDICYIIISIAYLLYCILVGGWATPLKNMSSSIGMMTATQYEWENKIDGNQTTNQQTNLWFMG